MLNYTDVIQNPSIRLGTTGANAICMFRSLPMSSFSFLPQGRRLDKLQTLRGKDLFYS